MAAVVEDVLVRAEDAIGQPIVAHVLPDILDRVEFWRFRRQRHQGDVIGDGELVREMPAGLIEHQHGVTLKILDPAGVQDSMRSG